MKSTLSILFVYFYFMSFGQTWADDVATIVYNKCAQCHHTGGAGGFPLTTYSETNVLASIIQGAVSADEMPPWPPNNNFQQYSHNRALSATEKTTILDWIAGGTPEGNPANTPPPPVFQTGAILGAGDLEVQIPMYMSKATASEDDYVCFALPSNLGDDRVIKSIEVVPGNPEIVHHCLVYIDANSNGSATDTIGGDCQGPSSPTAKLVGGFTPGSTPTVLPSVAPLKIGYPMAANSQIYLGMHFPSGSYGEYDDTKVIFHFYPIGETGIRELTTDILLDNWTFSLPPEQITPVSDIYPSSGGLLTDYSLVNIFPHMHLIGKSMKVYGIKPNFDTLKLMDLPEWDFEWQDFYYYKNMQKAEVGTVLHADAVYDNTSGNPNNPNTPPITVGAGLNTADEMLVVFMSYLPYLPGDENYNMDSLLNLSTATLLEQQFGASQFSLYPNPFHEGINIYSNNVSVGDKVSVYIYDTQGKLVKPLMKGQTLTNNELLIEWDGKNEVNKPASPGLYFLSINVNGVMTQHRVIKQ
ncbi:MAG: T9SS type A sorting domain-containing protein [Crocinitomicaceae bacterium]|nr:T9SS type A sorting domain-containing protein [Crocinitomicaceae bacterium]